MPLGPPARRRFLRRHRPAPAAPVLLHLQLLAAEPDVGHGDLRGGQGEEPDGPRAPGRLLQLAQGTAAGCAGARVHSPLHLPAALGPPDADRDGWARHRTRAVPGVPVGPRGGAEQGRAAGAREAVLRVQGAGKGLYLRRGEPFFFSLSFTVVDINRFRSIFTHE